MHYEDAQTLFISRIEGSPPADLLTMQSGEELLAADQFQGEEGELVPEAHGVGISRCRLGLQRQVQEQVRRLAWIQGQGGDDAVGQR